MHNTTMNNIDHSTAPIILKINIPDKGIFEKRFTFNHDDKVWAAKEQVIHEIGKEFKDIQNYGFFVPPYQGKAGKFMDEGRPVSEYSIPGDDQILEFILKRRIYRSISYDENKLTKLHTKTNLKKLMDLVELNNAGQVNQLLEKGLDPNFQDLKSGETPLTTAAVKDNATEVIMFLVNGGAYLDFRNRNGITAVHRAAHVGNGHNIKAFLDLGASPNYRDLKGLTPLYHACLSGKNPNVAELLLGDQSDIGVVDSQGWQEIHQVCRYGHLQHLEQLIFYGADLNAQNGSGNTPLHITALYNQEDCARLLLYRGARRDIVNFANQTAEMVAVVATNVSLSVFIKNYNENDVVPYIDKPTYSTRRRTQSKSRPTANSVFLRGSTDTFIFCSETLSTNSSTSLLSETSEPMSLDLSPREILPQVQSPAEEKSPVRKYKRTRTMSGSGSDSSYVTDSGDETGGSAYTTPIQSPTNDDLQVRWRTYSLSSLNKEERGNVPRVKGVRGAANMKPSGKSNSRKVYVAVKNFTPSQAGELSLMEGDLVEVVTKGEKGYWQGSVSGKTGWFPAECIEELKKRKHKSKNSLHKPPSVASSLNKSNTSLDQTDKPALVAPQPRQVILHQRTGFGFQMKGASAPTVNKLEYQLSEKIPALQYVGSVEPGGVAEERGVRKGDYILEVNGNDVRTASHRHVVSLIRKSGKTLIMKIISVDNGQNHQKETSNTTKTPVALQGTSPPASRPPGSCDKPPMPVVNGTSHGNGVRDHKASKPPPIPSRAPTTSLTRPKTTRLSVEDADVDKSPNIQEDRVITVPRERISPSDSQWQSPLTGHSSLPRRPKSSYGAIIGFTHGPSESTAHKNYRPVESLDNTGFMTLPSKSSRPPNVRQPAAQDDSAVTRRREGSRSKDRPKSWMPKVLPTELPPSAPRSPPKQPSPDALVPHNEETRGDSKKDKKRRFSFKKKKEKDYTAVAAPADGEPLSDDAGVEGDATDENVAENLQIEGEERPNTLPGLNKRLTTFKPVTIPHRQNVENEAVSPELSQALEKRMLRTSSSGSHEGSSTAPPSGYHPPVHSNPPVPNPDVHKLPVNAAAVPVFPVSQLRASAPKSLEQSIKEEMMRRRSNSTSVSGVPAKPRRTFEYKKLDNNNDEGAEPGEQKSDLDSELAKAIARRAAKITSEPAKETPIYENIQNFAKDNPAEPRSSVEEPPVLSIDEKLKKLHLNDEVFLPTKFKPPVKPPPGKGPPEKRPSDKGLKGKVPLVKEPPKEESKVKNRVDIVPSGKPHPLADRPEESTAHGKPPPKTFPKPKKKPSSTASEDTANDVEKTPRPVMTLPLSTEQRMTHIPPPVLSPEMVATQFLDDVIDEEVKRSNWDTASWKDKDLSTPRSSNSPAETGSPAATTPNVTDGAPQEGLSTSSPKKKYVYKITLVTEKAAEGTQSVEEQGSGVTQTRSSESTAKTYVISTDKSERSPPSPPPPPPPPPIEFHDENPVDLSSPVFTPPSSPPPPLVTAIDISPGSTGSDANPVVTSSSSCGTEEESSPGAGAPSPQTEPPPPLVEEQPTPPIGNEPPQSVQEPPPPNVQEAPPPPVEEPPPQHVSEPSTLPVPDSHLSVEEPAPPVQEPPSPPIQEVPPPPPAEEPPPPPMKEPPPPPMTEPPPPPITEPPPPPTEEPPSPPVQELPSPPVQAPPPPPVQEPAPPPVEEQPPPKPMQELPPPPTEPPPPPPTEETPSPPKDSPLLTPEQSPFEKSKTDASSPGEETSPDSFTSPLPPPVITPHTERSLNGAAQTAAVTGAVNASGLKEERMGVPPDHIVVPPPVFADSGDDVRESAQQDETSTPAEMLVSDDIGRSEPVPENAKSVVDGPEKVASVEETSGSVSGPDAAPAPSGDLTEQNVNVVDPSTTNTGQNGELAPQEAVGSDAFSSSLTFRDMSYENWTCVHVCQWLDSIGMAEHQGLFEENDIRGVNLSGLTKEDLKELGVKKLGHRMTMADAVHTLAINHGAATNL